MHPSIHPSHAQPSPAQPSLVGIARAVHRRSRLRVFAFLFWFFLLVVVLWCVGNPDLWDRGLVCFWGTFLLWLVYPNLPFAWAPARARITFMLKDSSTQTQPFARTDRQAQSVRFLLVSGSSAGSLPITGAAAALALLGAMRPRRSQKARWEPQPKTVPAFSALVFEHHCLGLSRVSFPWSY